MFKYFVYDGEKLVGELLLGSYDNKLCIADYRYRKMRTTVDSRIQKGLKAAYEEDSSEVIVPYHRIIGSNGDGD